jgi:hypothetical protein
VVIVNDGAGGRFWPSGFVVLPLDEDPAPAQLVVFRFESDAGRLELVKVWFEFAHLPDMTEADLREWLTPRATGWGNEPVVSRPGGITIRQSRGIRLGEMHAAAREILSNDSSVEFLTPDGWAVEARRRSGPAGKDDTHYAHLAIAYEALVLADRRPVVQLLAEQFHVSRQTASNQLAEARRRGLLEAPGRGAASGRATERAHQLVRQTKGEH